MVEAEKGGGEAERGSVAEYVLPERRGGKAFEAQCIAGSMVLEGRI